MIRKLLVCVCGGILLLCAVIMSNMSKLKYKHERIAYPTIYFITPTYFRKTQRPDLTRLAQTLYPIKGLVWIVVEDSEKKSSLVTEILAKYNIDNVQLFVKTDKNATHKGLAQRNVALDWIRKNHIAGVDKAVVYFGDDDNSYDWLLFQELRKTKHVGVLPVGLAGGTKPGERPIVKDGKVVSFYGWNSRQRKFALDMAGFVFNADLLLKYPNLKFVKTHSGFLETDFLQQFVKMQDMEPLAENCSKFYVWHVKTV